MYLTETHIIKKENPLYKEADYLCFLSKNLYNATLYEVRQHYFKTKEYLNYKKVNDLFTHNNQKDYRALPAKVSRGTQKQVEYDMKSFFASLKKKTKRKARIPHYADSLKGRKPLHYPKDALSFRKIPGYVCLSKTNIAVKSRIPAEKIEYVNIIPCAGYIMICIGYKKDCLKSFSGKGGYASIDLGLNNLASVCSDKFSPFIVNGKPLKSINQYYNKKKAEYQSLLPAKH